MKQSFTLRDTFIPTCENKNFRSSATKTDYALSLPQITHPKRPSAHLPDTCPVLSHRFEFLETDK